MLLTVFIQLHTLLSQRQLHHLTMPATANLSDLENQALTKLQKRLILSGNVPRKACGVNCGQLNELDSSDPYSLILSLFDKSGHSQSKTPNYQIKAVVKKSAHPKQLRLSILEAKRADEDDQITRDQQSYSLFIAPYISPASAAICLEEGWGYMDFAGNCHIAFANTYIHIEGKPNQHKDQSPLKNLYAEKSARVLRVILKGPLHGYKVKELAEKAKVSLGLVSKIRTYLLDQELAVDSPEGLLVSKPDDILNNWRDADSFTGRNEVQDYTLLETDPAVIAKQLRHHLDANQTPHAFTQWYGAYLRAPYTTPPVVSCYVDALPDDASLLHALGARPTSPGAGRLRLIRSSDYFGVTLGQHLEQGFNIVSDLQLYLDLNGAGLRADEQAGELKNLDNFNGGWTQ